MAVFKCKMCGGDLDVTEGITIAECDYCGAKQTIPKAIDENLQNLFNRANTLRIKSEFDKAEKLYEKIIQADSTQSDAYWGLILCKYGIEYVDDPKTFKKIPTCHRTSFDSIIADDDYKSAIENADISQRSVYEAQAKEIDRIQKEILALAQKEESYDVFICYKETDSLGKRTQDSVIANDIYHQLTQEGFKVFYAAITLENKLGSAYEPIIFAALHSAKVMLAIGTKPEYFNAVWVKNEWSRFLKMIKADRSKLLIPCYRDMDAYELPEEFAHLQAQDMSKIGFINDVVRGIQTVIKKDAPTQTTVVRNTVATEGNANIAPLLKRAFMFLEDGNWSSADEYCEKVLDQDPENGKAYLYKLLAQGKVSSIKQLKNHKRPLEQLSTYRNAVYYTDEQTAHQLKEYNKFIKDRIAEAEAYRIEQERIRAEKAKIANEKHQALTKKLREKEGESSSLEQQIRQKTNSLEFMRRNKASLETTIVQNRQQIAKNDKKAKPIRLCSTLILILASFCAVVMCIGFAIDDTWDKSTEILFVALIVGSLILFILLGIILAIVWQKSIGLAFLSYFSVGVSGIIFAIIAKVKYLKEIEKESLRLRAECNKANAEIRKTEEEIPQCQRVITALQNQLATLDAEIQITKSEIQNLKSENN